MADEPLRIPSGSASRSPFGAGRVSVASESESSARACVGAWSSFFRSSKSSGSAVWVGLRLELGSARVSWSVWSPMGGI